MKPVVVLDCDGILCDFVGAALDFVERQTGTRPAREDIRTWHIFDSVGDPAIRDAFNVHAGRPGFCECLAPFEEALEGFPALASVAEVHIATSPWDSPTWMWERTNWLNKHFGVPASHVHHERIKCLTRGDFFVDDHPNHVRDWIYRGHVSDPGIGLLWDTPHNRLDGGFQRVSSWNELTELVTTACLDATILRGLLKKNNK